MLKNCPLYHTCYLTPSLFQFAASLANQPGASAEQRMEAYAKLVKVFSLFVLVTPTVLLYL